MKILLYFFSVMFLTSCPTNDEIFDVGCSTSNPLEELAWLKELKTGFEQSASASASKKKIIQYSYNNEDVFLIDICNDCADNLTSLYNCEGKIICKFGGIAGINTCPDFEKEATNKIILWENSK